MSAYSWEDAVVYWATKFNCNEKHGRDWAKLYFPTRPEANAACQFIKQHGFVCVVMSKQGEVAPIYWVEVMRPIDELEKPDMEVAARPKGGDTLSKALEKETPMMSFPSPGKYRIVRNDVTFVHIIMFNKTGRSIREDPLPDTGVIECGGESMLYDYATTLKEAYKLEDENRPPRRKKSKGPKQPVPFTQLRDEQFWDDAGL